MSLPRLSDSLRSKHLLRCICSNFKIDIAQTNVNERLNPFKWMRDLHDTDRSEKAELICLFFFFVFIRVCFHTTKCQRTFRRIANANAGLQPEIFLDEFVGMRVGNFLPKSKWSSEGIHGKVEPNEMNKKLINKYLNTKF